MSSVPSISVSGVHTLLLDDGGTVWGMGDNSRLVLGGAVSGSTDEFMVIPGLPPIKQVSASRYPCELSVFLDVDGGVWICGDLMCEPLVSIPHPILVPMKVKIKSIYAGNNMVMMIDKSRRLWAFGRAGTPKGLDDNYRNTYPPKRVPFSPRVKKVECGKEHCIILDIDGDVWVMGYNEQGVLGLPYPRSQMVQTPVQLTKFTKVRDIATYNTAFFVLDKDRRAWRVGCNDAGELGIPDRLQSWTKIRLPGNDGRIRSIGLGNHSMLVTTTGTVWATGLNNKGQLGIGKQDLYITKYTKVENIPPIRRAYCGMFRTWLEDNEGNIWGTVGESLVFELYPDIPPIKSRKKHRVVKSAQKC